MTRYEKIKDLTIDELAQIIVNINITDDYCKGDCPPGPNDEIICNVEAECCKRWLMEEME